MRDAEGRETVECFESGADRGRRNRWLTRCGFRADSAFAGSGSLNGCEEAVDLGGVGAGGSEEIEWLKSTATECVLWQTNAEGVQGD